MFVCYHAVTAAQTENWRVEVTRVSVTQSYDILLWINVHCIIKSMLNTSPVRSGSES